MLIPLYVLGAGALLAGAVAFDWFVGHDWLSFLGPVRRSPEVDRRGAARGA